MFLDPRLEAVNSASPGELPGEYKFLVVQYHTQIRTSTLVTQVWRRKDPVIFVRILSRTM